MGICMKVNTMFLVPGHQSEQGGGGTRIPNQGLEGGVQPKAEKKKVTPPILMAEVVVDVPKGTSDGSPGVQDVFESLWLVYWLW